MNIALEDVRTLYQKVLSIHSMVLEQSSYINLPHMCEAGNAHSKSELYTETALPLKV